MYLRSVAAGVFTINDTVGVKRSPPSRDGRGGPARRRSSGSAEEVRRNPLADLSKWVLLHGASYPAELGYRQELIKWSSPTASSTGAR